MYKRALPTKKLGKSKEKKKEKSENIARIFYYFYLTFLHGNT